MTLTLAHGSNKLGDYEECAIYIDHSRTFGKKRVVNITRRRMLKRMAISCAYAAAVFALTSLLLLLPITSS